MYGPKGSVGTIPLNRLVNAYSLKGISHDIPNIDEINSIFTFEGTAADLMRRVERSKTPFARQTLKALKKVSPLSIAVVYE